MTSEELAGKIVSILESKKGSDIEVIDVAEKTTLADFFIICTFKYIGLRTLENTSASR